MRRRRTCPRAAALSIALAVAAAPACAGRASGGASDLARRIERILAREELRGTTVGIEIRRLAGGALLYENGAERLLPPASTTKIVSCAGALAVLGPDFRFETRVVRSGELSGGRLGGDLVLVASGDPNLSQRIGPRGELRFTDNDHTYAGYLQGAEVVPGDPLQVLGGLASQVKAAGVDRVEGSVVVDDGLFEETGDEFVGSLSAACVNDNVIDVLVTPAARAGEPPSITVSPSHPALAVENHARTVESAAGAAAEPELALEFQGGIGRFRLTGGIAVAATPVLCIGQLPEPALAAAHLFAAKLAEAGVEVAGPPRRARAGPSAYASAAVVARHLSPPLSEAVKVILKVSHNLHASMLPVIAGALRGEGGNRFAGYRLVHDRFQSAGIEVDGVTLRSGSGGGRADCLSARFLVSLLRHLAAREEAPAFFAALPLGGADGTLAGHFLDPRFRGRVRAKTGTLAYPGAFNSRWIYVSKALAGYLELSPPDPAALRPGRDAVAFAILFANTLARDRRAGSEALFRAQEDILAAVLEAHGR